MNDDDDDECGDRKGKDWMRFQSDRVERRKTTTGGVRDDDRHERGRIREMRATDVNACVERSYARMCARRPRVRAIDGDGDGDATRRDARASFVQTDDL